MPEDADQDILERLVCLFRFCVANAGDGLAWGFHLHDTPCAFRYPFQSLRYALVGSPHRISRQPTEITTTTPEGKDGIIKHSNSLDMLGRMMQQPRGIAETRLGINRACGGAQPRWLALAKGYGE